jgi:hypothetical protein
LALYFFHLRDGHDSLIDPDGREIAEAALIPNLALKEARAIIGHDATQGSIKLDQFIEVLDEPGALVHRLAFRDAVTIIG